MHIQERVQGLEQTLQTHERELRQTNRDRQRADEQHRALWRSMGIRERYLGGWFFGDKDQVHTYKQLREQETQYAQAARTTEGKIREVNNTIDLYIDAHLNGTSAPYRAIKEQTNTLRTILNTVGKYLQTIDHTLSEIDDAETMETFDLFSNNKGIALLSYMENEEASDALSVLKRRTQEFQTEWKALTGKNADVGGSVGVDDFTDFIFDMALDVDFMSFFTLGQLADANHAVQQMRAKAHSLYQGVTSQYEKAEAARQKQVSGLRAQLRSPSYTP